MPAKKLECHCGEALVPHAEDGDKAAFAHCDACGCCYVADTLEPRPGHPVCADNPVPAGAPPLPAAPDSAPSDAESEGGPDDSASDDAEPEGADGDADPTGGRRGLRGRRG